jgi:hypothetical protein
MEPILMAQSMTTAGNMLLDLGNDLAPVAWLGTTFAVATAIAIVGSALRAIRPERPSFMLPRPTFRIAIRATEAPLDVAA